MSEPGRPLPMDGKFAVRTAIAAAAASLFIALLIESASHPGAWYSGQRLLSVLFFYVWTLPLAVLVGIPAFLLARRLRVDNLPMSLVFGGLVGMGVGYWLGGYQLQSGVVLYGAIGAAAGVVFLLVQRMRLEFLFRRAGGGAK